MIKLRLLGELHVERDGQPVPLPASRKSRALLAFLAATARPHLRERLCEMLWEGPDDPRAALRWSLTKLRSAVDPHLVAGRSHVAFECEDADVDARCIGDPGTATTDALEHFASLFRGEFLEALDLPGCFRYQQWCVGERERFRQTHLGILAELTRRHGETEAALTHARRRVTVDPFNEDAHALVIRLLASLGHKHDALQQYEHCRQLFERELGSRPGAVVEEARRLVGTPAAHSRGTESIPAIRQKIRSAVSALPLIGRAAEIQALEASTDPVLLIGEPGIGKSRILEEVRARTAPTFHGRAYAAEMVRPYGVFSDLVVDQPGGGDRNQFFEAVVQRLAGLSLIAIDDLQWIDEASAALLHYIARMSAIRILCTARVGEVDDNPHAQRLVRDLRFTILPIGPLTDAETHALIEEEVSAAGATSAAERAPGSDLDSARVVRLSGGNPLFALELSRSGANPDAGAIHAVITSRLDGLSGSARELVAWAAAVGRKFDVETVGRATGMAAGDMLGALEKLERLTIIQPAGNRAYDFVHDLVRDAAYRLTSGPRRTLVHRHIARALGETHDPEYALAGDIVHHASLAGELVLACDAAANAGKRCLRLFAYPEAMTVARRGLQIAESLTGTERIEADMRLYHVLVMARTPVRERIAYAGRIAESTKLARQAGLAGTAGLGAHLLACLHEETNDYVGAAEATKQSAESSRGADPATAALSMATAARCLLVLERDIGRAEELLAQAQAIGVGSHELSLGLGYLCAHRGKGADAAQHLEEAFRIAASKQDHWREWMALTRLVTLALEEGDASRAIRHCARLHPVAAQMHGGSEAIRASVLESIARHASGETVDVHKAIARLHEIDSKSDLAWALSYLALLEGDSEQARAFAKEALVAADAVGRHSEALIARVILGQSARASRDISARAKTFLKENRNGRTHRRANI